VNDAAFQQIATVTDAFLHQTTFGMTRSMR